VKEPILWDLGTETGISRFPADLHSQDLVAAIDGDDLVFSSGGSLFRWEPATDKVTHVEQPHHTLGPWMSVLTVSRDSRHLGSSQQNGSIQVWNARTLEWEATLLGHSSQVVCIDFSPDGKVLASASKDGIIKLWDVATRQELMTLEGGSGDADGVRHLRFSPDGSALVYCFSDRKKGIAIVWPAPRDSEIHR
jgi:WD40 repeat protein